MGIFRKNKNVNSGASKSSSTKSYNSTDKIKKIIEFVNPGVMYTKNGFAKEFWWEAVSNRTYVKNWYNHVPDCLRALSKLCFTNTNFYSENEKKCHIIIDGKEQRTNTILLSRRKKEYFKPAILTNVGKYIIATTNSSQNIKYVFFGMISDSKRYSDDFKNCDSEFSQDVKIYEKEKQAFISAGFKYIGEQEVTYESHENARAIDTLFFDKYDHYLGEERVHHPSYDTIVHYTGWLFEIPKGLSSDEVNKIYNDIKAERYKQEHIV